MNSEGLIASNGDEIHKEEEDVHICTALNLIWSFGVNRFVPALNLSTSNRKALFYTTVHTGVLYNFEENSQILYQGHCNAISCTTVSADKRWLATADIGNDCLVIVWDTETSIPIRTLFDIDPIGIKAMAFSSDAKYLVLLSCAVPQVISVWNWTTESDAPLASLNVDGNFGLQVYICFNENDSGQLISNNGGQVIFYKWTEMGNMSFYAPALSDQDFNKTVGSYTQSIYHPSESTAFTATSCGNIVVWSISMEPDDDILEAKALKIVKIQEKGISVLHLLGYLIVTGDIMGNVKFFDLDLRLVNWYNKFGSQGMINSISFSYDNENTSSRLQGGGPISATLETKPFLVNDFSVSTAKANILYFDTKESGVKFIRKHNDQDIKAIACHPKQPYIAIGGFDGMLQIIDFENKIPMNLKTYKQRQITCVSYSNNGNLLAVGSSDGQVQVLDSVTLKVEGTGDTESAFNQSNGHILKMVFSHDSTLLACYDNDRCVIVFRSTGNKSAPWEYLGKHRAHYKQVVDIIFLTALDEKTPRLLSVGEDRMLVEYDLPNSSIDDLKVLSTNRIEQDAFPTCFASYPPVVKEDFIVTANNHYKLKLFNSTTKMCRYTFLGPTYGSPVKGLVALPVIPDAPNRYMAYITSDKVGLIILPLDGNPHKSMALIAHPGEVHNISCSFDGKYVFTAGGKDTSVLMWKVDVDSLEATASLGGEHLFPFYSLLEDGREGELFSELETYFYYAQVRNQGVDAMETRAISTVIPLSEIPFIMRALGYYPTEQEIDEMINEVKFSEYVATGKYVETIDIGGLLKLYVNHRPAFGVNPDDLVEAFQKIGYVDGDEQIKIDRSELLLLLQEKGEHLNETELTDCITKLLDIGDDDKDLSPLPLDEALPEQISMKFLTSDLLGFASTSEIGSQYSKEDFKL